MCDFAFGKSFLDQPKKKIHNKKKSYIQIKNIFSMKYTFMRVKTSCD